jgi:uncharacterized protein YaaR (DUF327 family)
MGIEARHSYRFGYLRSEHWQNLRVKALAECDARCFFCNERDLSNDVHHIHYPEDLYKTRTVMLRVLCRSHHERLHQLMDSINESGVKFGNTKIGHDLLLFKECAKTIEKEMGESGIVRYTIGGVRIRNSQHLDRLVPSPPKKLINSIREVDGFARQIRIMIQSDIGLSKECVDGLSMAESEVLSIASKMKTEMAAKYSLYGADFVRNETAG